MYVTLGFSALITAIIAIRTPPADIEPPSVSEQAVHTDDQAVHTVGAEQNILPQFVLPERAEEVDVEKVEKELVDLAEQLAKSYPNDPSALHVAALTYSELLQTTRAEELWKRCVDLSPNQPEPYVGLAKVLMQGGKDAQAVEVMQRAGASDQKSADLIQTFAEACEKLGNLEEAEKILLEGMRDFPSAGKNWLRLGQVRIQLGNFHDAEASIRRAIELGQVGVPTLVALTTALTRQGKSQEALEVRKQLAERMSKTKDDAKPERDGFQAKYAESFRGLAAYSITAGGLVHQQHDELQLAEGLLLRALSLDPNQLQCYVALASIYRKESRLRDAIAVHLRMIELQPDNILNYTNLASIAMQTGDEALSEKTLRQAAHRNPQSGVPHSLLARLYLATGRHAEAIAFAQVAADRLQTVDAYLVLISACQATGDAAAASRALEKARQLGPNDPRLANTRL